MSDNVFRYPGGKTTLADWVIGHFRDHRTYVEVFGGSAAVLANKEPSDVEVLNDRDGDIVQFFETLRDRADELVEWLRDTPYSRELHQRYATEYYDGHRPDDPVERAGRFWYLRETQFASKYRTKSGFKATKDRNVATTMRTKTDRLREFSDRFAHVQIECLDYADLFDLYDHDKALFYLDPPYVKEGDDLYTGDDFDHERFVDALSQLDGDWVVSYTDLPDGLEHLAETVAEKDHTHKMGQNGHEDYDGETTERLALSYDPDDVPEFSYAGQVTIDELRGSP